MKDKELIKQEIEETLNSLFDYMPSASKVLYNDFTKDEAVVLGKYKALEDILKFLDSLPKEPTSEDLEEEIKNYFSGWCMRGSREKECFFQIARHFAEWQEKKMLGIAEAFYQQGRYEQEQEMMKDAMELHIVASFNPVGTENEKPHGFTALCYNAEYSDFYPVTGQTIKIIPIKENNNEQD